MEGLTAKLKNRVEIYRKEKIDGELGTTFEKVLKGKAWSHIISIRGKVASGDGDTEVVETNFKIRMRPRDIRKEDLIIYKGLKYEVEYILPSFNTNSFIDVYCVLIEE